MQPGAVLMAVHDKPSMGRTEPKSASNAFCDRCATVQADTQTAS